MNNEIDHFTLGAERLDEGIAAMREVLGVDLPPGGKHPAMSTHNCVTRTDDGCFLEMIAIDREAPSPPRPRWFSLDESATQARLREGPAPLCWVVRTDSLDEVLERCPAGIDLGEVIPLSRGDLTWRLTVPADGSLPEGGLIPAFIEWSPGPHPSTGMKDVGIRLRELGLGHPDPGYLQRLLDALGIAHLATVFRSDRPTLRYDLTAPGRGNVRLS